MAVMADPLATTKVNKNPPNSSRIVSAYREVSMSLAIVRIESPKSIRDLLVAYSPLPLRMSQEPPLVDTSPSDISPMYRSNDPSSRSDRCTARIGELKRVAVSYLLLMDKNASKRPAKRALYT